MNDGMYSAGSVQPEESGQLPLDSDSLQRERDRLCEEGRRLSNEVERLTDENEALRQSIDIWIRLYERQLERANRALQV
jgi:hypothetical protein